MLGFLPRLNKASSFPVSVVEDFCSGSPPPVEYACFKKLTTLLWPGLCFRVVLLLGSCIVPLFHNDQVVLVRFCSVDATPPLGLLFAHSWVSVDYLLTHTQNKKNLNSPALFGAFHRE